MQQETFRLSGPGYLEYAGTKLGERLWGDTLLCNRVEVRETRAEFEVHFAEFRRSERNESEWIAIEAKRRVFETFSNKASAVRCATFIQRGYCQQEQADLVAGQELDREWEQKRLLARQEVKRERDQVNIWQDDLGKWHWDSPYYEICASRGLPSRRQAVHEAQRFLSEQRGEIEHEI